MARKAERSSDAAVLHKQVRVLTRRYQAVANPDRLLILAMVDLAARSGKPATREELKAMVSSTRARPGQSRSVDFHLRALMGAGLVTRVEGVAGYSCDIDDALREEILPLEEMIAGITGRQP
jgi:hypothetical protein